MWVLGTQTLHEAIHHKALILRNVAVSCFIINRFFVKKKINAKCVGHWNICKAHVLADFLTLASEIALVETLL